MGKTYKPMAGESINETAAQMTRMSNEANCPVAASFNDIPLTANPGISAEEIVSAYQNESDRRRSAWLASPEYKEQKRQAEQKATQKKLALENALRAAPEKMSLRDSDAWKSWVGANTDPYGSACICYAELWARLMEGRIASGGTVETCAEELSYLADTEGITGFMYGCAVSMLSKAWIHGEVLRRWHNLKTQIGNEGEKANKSGGVLNPAVLNIGS